MGWRYIYISPLLPRLRNHCAKRVRKSIRARGGRRIQCLMVTVEQLHTGTQSVCGNIYRICASSSQTKVQHGERNLQQIPTSNHLATGNCQLLQEKDTISSKSTALVSQVHSNEKSIHLSVFEYQKLVLMGFKKTDTKLSG